VIEQRQKTNEKAETNKMGNVGTEEFKKGGTTMVVRKKKKEGGAIKRLQEKKKPREIDK